MAQSVIVALATAWGPKFGGINAFNADLVKSLGILPERSYELVCVVPGPVTPEVAKDSGRFSVRLLGLDLEAPEFNDASAAEIARRLDSEGGPERFLWIGHDDKTGPLALQLKSLLPGSRAVVINHMAHGAYQSVKKGASRGAADKRQAQLGLFLEADLCLAVGPMLYAHLQDLLACQPNGPPMEMLIPGLADPTEYGVRIRDSAPANFAAFIAGRLDAEDDRIKQGRLALRAFGTAVRRAGAQSAIRLSPALRMRGVRPAEEVSLRNLLLQEAEGSVTFDFQDYTEEREAYFRDLASSSVAMMPSWHEGFGLTAWEAIACALPVIIGEQSGVYRLLHDRYSGAGLGQSVAPIPIDGWRPDDEEEASHTERDVGRVADALLAFGDRMHAAKQEALTLRRNLLDLGADWTQTARGLLAAIYTHLGCSLTATAPPVAISAPVPSMIDAAVPEWLRSPSPRPWRPELRLPTSELLTARDEIVRFDPERQGVLDQLLAWTEGPAALAARLVVAPGGSGKTRLAIELSRQLRRKEWLVLWLSSRLPEQWSGSLASILSGREEKPALLVIDYAESRPADVVTALGQALATLRASDTVAPMRVLLVGRSEAWLRDLPKNDDCPPDLASWLSAAQAIEPAPLPPWSRDEDVRLASYRIALEDYARALRVAAPANAYVPRLSEAVFDRPLYLHLAALAALEGQRPESADALLRSQLLREWQHWKRVHGSGIAYDDWADALAYLVLNQGATTQQTGRALEALGVDAPALPAALQRSYAGGGDRIAPLEPDLIAEALLRERLAERRGAALLDQALESGWESPPPALAVLARLAARNRPVDRDHLAAWEQALIAAAARHWPRHRGKWLAAAHGAEYGLGEIPFAAWESLDDPARTAVAARLNLYEYSANLLRITVAIRRQQVEMATDPAERAWTLNNLGLALADLGDAASRNEALFCARESLLIRRRLAESEPAAYLPAVAMSLNNLALRLAEQGDAASRSEALACALESLQIYRRLAESEPAAYLPKVALSLNNLALRLAEQGDAASRSEALACAREALRIYRRLAESEPAAYLPKVAMSFNNLGNRLAEQGDAASRSEALACAREALQIRRRLAESEPAAYLPAVATSLHNLVLALAEQGDAASRGEALACAREAVRTFASLHASMPAAFEDRLRISVGTLARIARDNDLNPDDEVAAVLGTSA